MLRFQEKSSQSVRIYSDALRDEKNAVFLISDEEKK
jgi:hypothetical protein